MFRFRLPLLAFAGLTLLWGSEWILAASLPAQPRLRWLALQYGLVALLLLPVALRKKTWRHGRTRLVGTALSGACLLAIPQILMLAASGHLASDIPVACLALVPLVLAISGCLPIPLAVLGLAGVLFIASRSLHIAIPQLPWALLPLLAAVVVSEGLVLAERQVRVLTIGELLFVQCAVCGLLLWLASRWMEPDAVAWSAASAAGLAVSAIVAILGAYAAFYWLLRQAGAARVSALQWSQPLVTVVESAAFFQVHFGWTEILGTALIIGAVVAVFCSSPAVGGVFLQITQD